MKVFCVITVARQVEGEMVSIRFEKAFKSVSKAEAYAKTLATNYTENIQTQYGPIQFMCERGIHEFLVEE